MENDKIPMISIEGIKVFEEWHRRMDARWNETVLKWIDSLSLEDLERIHRKRVQEKSRLLAGAGKEKT